jgi:hypothetical protein
MYITDVGDNFSGLEASHSPSCGGIPGRLPSSPSTHSLCCEENRHTEIVWCQRGKVHGDDGGIPTANKHREHRQRTKTKIATL